jgi:hypothetical protein
MISLRFSAALITGAVLTVSSLAHAKTPIKSTPAPQVLSPAASTSTASGIAQVETILSYCESVDPQSLAKYERLRNLVLSGYAPSVISNNKKSAAYQSEVEAFGAALAQIPVSTGVSTCRAGAAKI